MRCSALSSCAEAFDQACTELGHHQRASSSRQRDTPAQAELLACCCCLVLQAALQAVRPAGLLQRAASLLAEMLHGIDLWLRGALRAVRWS